MTGRGRVRRALERPLLRRRFGDLRRTAPLSGWGYSRGTPVDRWCIQRWLRSQADDVRGLVLEVQDDVYASGLGADRVEVVDVDPENRRADVVGDLCRGGTLEPGRYDAAVVTQTLQYLADPAAAVRHLLEALRPGGVLLLTVPTTSRLAGPEDRWRWTQKGLASLLADTVPPGAAVEVTGMGNALTCRAFVFGLAAEDLSEQALTATDERYPLVVGARVRLPA